MAPFNPQIQVDLGGNYTGASGGTKSSLAALGTLFEGVGNTVNLFAQNQDQANQFDIQQTADQQVGSILDQTLQGAPLQPQIPPVQAGSSSAVPTEITRGGAQLQKLQQAYNEGKLSDLNLYQSAARISQRLRDRYPHYGPEIDQAVMGAIGRSPANAIRNELNQKFAAEQASANDAMKFRRNEFQKWINDGTLARMNVKPSEVDVQDENQWLNLQNRAAVIAGADAKDKAAQAKLTLMKSARENTQADAYDQAASAINQRHNEFFNHVNTVYTNFMKQFAEKEKDGFTPQEKTDLTAMYGKLTTDYEQGLQRMLTDRNPQTGFSWSEHLNPDDQKKLIANEMQTFDSYKNLLFDEHFGAIGAANRENQAINDGFANQSLKDLVTKPELGVLRAAKRMQLMGVDPSLQQMILQGTGVVENWNNQMKAAYTALSLGTITGEIKDLPAVINELSTKNGITDPVVWQTLTNNLGLVLSDSKLTGEQANGALQSIVNSKLDGGLLGQFGQGATREQVFKSIASPELAQKIKDQPVFAQYERWVGDGFVSLVHPAVQNIASIGIDPKYVDVTYDEGKHHFVATFNIPARVASGSGRGGNPNALQDDLQQKATALQERIGFVNQYIDVLDSVTSISGKDTNAVVKQMFQGIPMSQDMFILNQMKQGLLNPPEEGTQKTSAANPEAGILNFVRNAEDAGYNTLYGGGKADLSHFTVNEAMQLGASNPEGSSAVGGYQFMKATLQSLIAEGKITGSEMMTPDVQDKLAIALMNRRGLNDYRAGKITKEQFAHNLSKEWASLPKDASNKSYYEGDKMGNHARVGWTSFLAQL